MKLKNNSRHSLVKWVAISTILVVVLATGGYFGFQYYQYYQADKIYSVDDIVSLPNFKIDITKSEFKSVDLSLDKDSITKYGGLDKQENCTTQSRERTWWKAWDNDPDAPGCRRGDDQGCSRAAILDRLVGGDTRGRVTPRGRAGRVGTGPQSASGSGWSTSSR